MKVILSGEGPSDLGSKNGSQFQKGPMCYILDVLFAKVGIIFDYDYKSEHELKLLKKEKRRFCLGKKGCSKEHRDFFISAKMLALYAKDDGAKDSIVILFKDSDGTRSASSSLWQEKWDAVISGFSSASFENGIPMIPRPKSEAWLLGYYQKNLKNQTAYNNCERFEEYPGNDASQKSLKKLLSTALKTDNPYELIKQEDIKNIDWDRINMPSFNKFKERFNEVVKR